MEYVIHNKRSRYRAREKWWWTLQSGNGKVIATSAEKYVNHGDMMDALTQVQLTDTSTPIRYKGGRP